ncbi:DUF4150 domain-containing protein [Achromobacter insolitus]|jgi:hypothetical protein|uniref:Uncharacterized protein n=1 Tax=Achromobacter insolitus TaxID=217204 RepID=A0A6S7F999_9BURK|nr:MULTISPECIES: DUF4150 domain-containing protein [Achromobacter]GLK94393.1 hypothetical protein GCM10008164_21310 [Achromobacter xylosoxidans]APX77796.1 type VI secretion protein [Achromobacter insolitus]AVG42250.1 DUF4150 domain-containing protein [Achromobacter insolitus]AXA73686.1 type VI secretion protein [Achromobacter insolitus]MCP1400249.1 hypothetical protein [Achromobacter insolitus]
MLAVCQLPSLAVGVPDVCKTPVPPIPHIDTATSAMGIPVVWNVWLMAAPVHNMATLIPVTLGDTAGVGGGLISQTFMGQSRYMTGAFTMLVRGAPIVRMTSLTLQNTINAPGFKAYSPQPVMVVLTT